MPGLYPDAKEAEWSIKAIARTHRVFPVRIMPGDPEVDRDPVDGRLRIRGERLRQTLVERGLTVAFFVVHDDSLYWAYGPDAVSRARG